MSRYYDEKARGRIIVAVYKTQNLQYLFVQGSVTVV